MEKLKAILYNPKFQILLAVITIAMAIYKIKDEAGKIKTT